MPKALTDEEPFSLRTVHPRETIYPWETWLEGQPLGQTFFHGEDFHVDARSFISTAHRYFRKRGKSVETSMSEDGLMVNMRLVDRPARSRPRKGGKDGRE